MRVVVVGAAGYVGSRLVPALLARGHEVVATRRRPRTVAFPWAERVTWREVDVHDEDGVVATFEGADAVCYLVHGLDDGDFMARDRHAADTVRHAVGAAGVGRLVYVSGIVPEAPREELSEHLLSRLEVEEVLAAAGPEVSVLTLRASMVVGAGSTSFEVLRQVSRRLGPVQAVPTWMGGSVIQPVAVADAVWWLAEALERPDVVGHLDVVGPDRLTYADLLRRYAAAAGLWRVQLPVWAAPVTAVARLTGRLVDAPDAVVGSLVPSLGHDMVGERDAVDVLGVPPDGVTALDDAIRRALAPADPEHDGADLGGDPQRPSAGDPGWAADRGVLAWLFGTLRRP